MSKSAEQLRNQMTLVALMICDLIRTGHAAEADEAIRQGRSVGSALGPYPPDDTPGIDERLAGESRAYANMFTVLADTPVTRERGLHEIN